MAILGCVSFDALQGDNIGFPYQINGNPAPARITGGPHSDGGCELSTLDGDTWFDIYDDNSADTYWHYLCIEGKSVTGISDGDDFTIFFNNKTWGNVDGMVRVMWEADGARLGHFVVQVYNGTDWSLEKHETYVDGGVYLESTESDSMTDDDANWTTNQWVGYTVSAGGKFLQVASNTQTKITGTQNWEGGAPADGTEYGIYRGIDTNDCIYYMCLETVIDTVTAANNKVRLYVNDVKTVDYSPSHTLSATGTFCIQNRQIVDVGKESADVVWKVWEHFANDDSGSDYATRFTYTSAETDPHVYGNMPDEDIDSVWTAVNGEAGCATVRWRTVNDAYDDADVADDYIKSTTQNDLQTFGITDQKTTATASTQYGVSVTALSTSSTYQVDELYGECPSDSGSPGGGAGTSLGGPNVGRFIFWAKTPSGSNRWDAGTNDYDKFNELEIGVKNTHATAERRVYILCVDSLGINQEKPANATACPASARRIFICHTV